VTTAVRVAGPDDHAWIVATARTLLGDEMQVHSRRRFTVLDGEVLLATVDGRNEGFATWDHTDGVAEILAIGVRTPRGGLGGELVAAVRERARQVGCARLAVVTTDENVGAQRFYAATGFTLVERRVGAVDECRRRYKPSIPADIHDELEYATDLDHDAREETH
jgi:N-acetylglutamate synthase-like GNAT family acetyltransferase